MNEIELAEKIKLLPKEKKQQLEILIGEILSSENLSDAPQPRKPGFAKGLVEMLPGFDDPIEGMEEYIK